MVSFYAAPNLTFAILDLPPIRGDEDAVAPGFWVAAAAEAPTERFSGAEVFWSRDDQTYVSVGSVLTEATMGRTTTELAAPKSCYAGYWDRENTVDIELSSGFLSSVDDEDVLTDGKNFALLGAEIIAFRDVTQIDEVTWRLSHLLRGRRNTQDTYDLHEIGEVFTLLDDALAPIPSNLSDVGATRFVKVVAVGGDVIDAVSVEIELSGARLRPFAPVHVTGERDGSANLTIRWVPRTRAAARLLGPAIPHACFCEEDRYLLDLFDPAAPSTVVRTVEVEDALETIYTATQQTADGITPGAPVIVEVARASRIFTKGTAARYTV